MIFGNCTKWWIGYEDDILVILLSNKGWNINKTSKYGVWIRIFAKKNDFGNRSHFPFLVKDYHFLKGSSIIQGGENAGKWYHLEKLFFAILSNNF